jgi:hypothetical protein
MGDSYIVNSLSVAVKRKKTLTPFYSSIVSCRLNLETVLRVITGLAFGTNRPD